MTLTLVPMNSERIARWLALGRAQYIDERMGAGETRAEAEANAEASYNTTFPDGRATPSQKIFDVHDDGHVVGQLWIAPRHDAEPAHWWVWEIEIDEEFRGRGFGRATMLLAEEQARSEGASSLGLNVFGGNAVARGLYASMDYRETSIQMRKDLSIRQR
ncbi:GNAT family N-acetyltransferase [Rhodococcus sp. G-MC3]|uniref:GNAT family N-acetyltransferase n=1 Tax=Rhodococcus sp. G-MC3 TaxID=3046209 RepID=UPI0024BAF99C|nr:GNAT family N-acetyltransferase [Rhodococcus sp. G-MC3]MDJ0394007.1 GNAT family N-acetyltransferase [Rhodococcus sp. G-MC3]